MTDPLIMMRTRRMDRLRLVMPPILFAALSFPFTQLAHKVFPTAYANGIIAGAFAFCTSCTFKPKPVLGDSLTRAAAVQTSCTTLATLRFTTRNCRST